MTIERSREFQAFIDGRTRLNEQLDRLRLEIDAWLAKNDIEDDRGMAEIAKLAGLLETRKDLLNELAQLDDRFLQYLLHLRGSQKR